MAPFPKTQPSETEMKVFRAIERAANAGEVCPSNLEMAARFGFRSSSWCVKALKRLEEFGLVVVERFSRSRVVLIVSSGKRTAAYGDKQEPNFSTGASRPTKRKKAGKRVKEPEPEPKPKPDEPVPDPVPHVEPPLPPLTSISDFLPIAMPPSTRAISPEHEPTGCRFIIGDPSEDNWRYCQKPGDPYCPHHHAICCTKIRRKVYA